MLFFVGSIVCAVDWDQHQALPVSFSRACVTWVQRRFLFLSAALLTGFVDAMDAHTPGVSPSLPPPPYSECQGDGASGFGLCADTTLDGRATVVCGFPGVGMTTFALRCADNGGYYGQEVIDLDPYRPLHYQGDVSRVRYWDEYLAELRALLLEDVVLLLPIHDQIRSWLLDNGVPFILFVPKRAARERWIRHRVRAEVAAVLDDSWDRILDHCHASARGECCALVELGSDAFLDRVVMNDAFVRLVFAYRSQLGG